ncbi:MAG: hypothetical protein GY710_19670 [Desulfobacteraceae bacterium]|nr:hypothetical protein [Desulfobacteraceae bacterium]
MKKIESRITLFILIGLFILAYMGDIYQVPRFAGSALGGLIGIIAAFFMFFPAIYMLVKRIKFIRKAVTKIIPKHTLLTIHIYATLFAAILTFVHSGNMEKTFYGQALTLLLLIIIGSGYTGRYLMGFLIKDIKKQKAILTRMDMEYTKYTNGVEKTQHPAFAASLPEIIFAMADLDFSIHAQDKVKKLFSRWLNFHIGITMIFYAILVLHIWTGIDYGIRWYP